MGTAEQHRATQQQLAVQQKLIDLKPFDLDAINEIQGHLGDAARLLHALAKLIDALECDKDDSEPLIGVTYAALEKIEAAIELVEPAKPKVI
jgi:hypothetical protein